MKRSRRWRSHVGWDELDVKQQKKKKQQEVELGGHGGRLRFPSCKVNVKQSETEDERRLREDSDLF